MSKHNQLIKTNMRSIAMTIILLAIFLPSIVCAVACYYLATKFSYDHQTAWLLSIAAVLTIFRLSFSCICTYARKLILRSIVESVISYLIIAILLAYIIFAFITENLESHLLIATTAMILVSAYIAKSSNRLCRIYRQHHLHLYNLLVNATAHWHYFIVGSIKPISYETWQNSDKSLRLKGIIFENNRNELMSILITDITNDRKDFEKELRKLTTKFISDEFESILSLPENENLYKLPDSILYFENC